MSSSKLQEYVYNQLINKYPNEDIRFNCRPEWLLSSDLKRLELDIFIPNMKTAIEVQGEQHYKYTPFFHRNLEEFRNRVRLDKEKYELCSGQGVYLFEVCQKSDLDNIINHLDRIMNKTIHRCKKDIKSEKRMMKSLRQQKNAKLMSRNVAIYIFRMVRLGHSIDEKAIEYYRDNEEEVNKYIDEMLSNLDGVQKKQKIHPENIKCIVVDENNNIYKIVPYPEKEGSKMLLLNSENDEYIFLSKKRALSAISHTIDYHKSLGLDKITFIIKVIAEDQCQNEA